MAKAAQIIESEIKKNPEVSLILEIAARAHEVESREPPKEIRISTEATAMPTASQVSV